MREVVLGKTGLLIKVLGFGGIPIQRVSEKEAISVVRKCYESGINYYDTARNYTVSEERIGKALEGVRDDIIIATKSNKRTGKELLTELETSLKNLRTDRIDVYQLHNVSSKKSWEQIKGPGGALNAVYRALDEGKIEHLGVTSHDPDFLTDIIEEDIFETAMIPFNYLTPIPQKRLLPLCRKTNVGTVIMKPLGGGAFSNIETALKFVLGSENVDVVIPGMMTSREVEENIKIANGPFTLLERDNSLIERDKRELGNEFCRACNYCQPCLQDVPISFVLRAESQFLKRMGWRPGTEERINNAIEKAKGCIECGECEERCPYKLPIRELLKEKTSSLISLLEERTR